MVTVEDARRLASTLPRAYEVVVRDRIKFRVGSIVFVAFSRDETMMGFGFLKEERDALVASDPQTFQLPPESDLRFNWVVLRLEQIELVEMNVFVLEAWRMVVPKFLYRDYIQSNPTRDPGD